MATELEELQALNKAFSEFVEYEKAKDEAAALAAAEEKTALAAEKEAAATAVAAAAAEEAAFRSSLLTAISEIDSGEAAPAAAADYTTILQNIETALAPDADRMQVDYYADLAVIFLIVVVLPIYYVYRVYQYVFGRLARAF